jgi:hypothetical protein
MYFSNMASVASVSRVSRLATWATRMAVRGAGSVGDVLHSHDGALFDQPIKAGGMDSSRALGADTEIADIVEPVDQPEHIGRRR